MKFREISEVTEIKRRIINQPSKNISKETEFYYSRAFTEYGNSYRKKTKIKTKAEKLADKKSRKVLRRVALKFIKELEEVEISNIKEDLRYFSLEEAKAMRCGSFPRYIEKPPLAPSYKASEGLSFISFIYVLVDLNDNTVRYVGKTKDIYQREKDHKKISDFNKSLMAWKTFINFNFKLKIVAVVDYEEWEDAEKAWINYYRRIGIIYNISPGGR